MPCRYRKAIQLNPKPPTLASHSPTLHVSRPVRTPATTWGQSPESLDPPPAPTPSPSHNPYEKRIKHFVRGLYWTRAVILVALGPVIGWSLLGSTFVISSRTLLDISEIWLVSSIFVLYLYALLLVTHSATARYWRRKESQSRGAWKAGTLNSFALRALLKTPPPPSSTAPTRCRRGIALGRARRWRFRR